MRYIIIIALALLSINTSAQKHVIGISGGVNSSSIKWQYSEPRNANSFYSMHSGVTYENFINNGFYIGTDLLYNQRGFKDKFYITGPTDGAVGYLDYTYKIDYLSLPLKLGYRTQGNLHAFLNLGIMPSLRVNTFINMGDYHVLEPIEMIISDQQPRIEDKVFDLAVLAEIGLGYKLNHSFRTFVSAAYQRSITNLKYRRYEGIPAPLYGVEYGYMFSVGIKYALSDKS